MDRLILSSKVGTFYFYPGTLLSHAKLIRDTIMGQILSPKGKYRVSGELSATEYIREEVGGPAALVPFAFYPSSGRR